jgi:hypothetical protein
LIATNCLISGNTANSTAGISNSKTMSLTNCTITGNTAAKYSGAIFHVEGMLKLYNTIIVENRYLDVEVYAQNPGTILSSHNLLGVCNGWSNCYVDNLVNDPLKPLFTNATTGDYRLAPNSQAINRGSISAAIAAGLALDSSTRDLAGYRRFAGAGIDIGAYEYDATTFVGSLVVTVLTDELSQVPDITQLSLREALLLAKDGDVITFAPGLFIGDDNEMVMQTMTLQYGELKIANSVTIVGMIDVPGDIGDEAGIALLTIDAGGMSRVMSVMPKSGSIDVTLKNITLKGGDASRDGVSQGGALYVKNAQLTLTNVAFVGNKASYGGAMFMTNAVVTMTGVTMTGNTGNWGGAICQTGGTLTINSGALLNNTGQRGGAIYQSDGQLRVDDVRIADNTSTWGGGMYQAGGTATLTQNTKFENNSAKRFFGSVLFKMQGAKLTIENSERTFNEALSQYLEEVDW